MFTVANTFISSVEVNLLNAKRITEQIYAVTGTAAGPFSLNYSLGSVFYLSGTQPTAPYACSITNIPANTTSNQYTVTLLYTSTSSTTVVYCNSATASDTSTASITLAGTNPKYPGNSNPAPTVTTSTIYAQSLTLIQCYTGNKCILGNLNTFG
jgi:hypothetical protein